MNPQVGVMDFSQFGLNGIIIGTLFAFIYFLVKLHSNERKEWLQAYKQVAEMADSRQAETNGLLSRIVERREYTRRELDN